MATAASFAGSLWDDDDHITRQYRRWRQENPEAYVHFVRFARELLRAGRRHYSVDALGHRVRWHVQIERKEQWKVNNNYLSLISRDLMREGVVPTGFFELRKRTAR